MKGFLKRLTILRPLLLVASLVVCGCTSASTTSPQRETEVAANPININTADLDSLQALPGIGQQLAAKIIEHRLRYGPFRKREHLLTVDGISERRYRDVEKLITTN